MAPVFLDPGIKRSLPNLASNIKQIEANQLTIGFLIILEGNGS